MGKYVDLKGYPTPYYIVYEERLRRNLDLITQVARDAGVKQLLIGHFSARYEDESVLLKEAADIFPHTVLAKEMLRISL